MPYRFQNFKSSISQYIKNKQPSKSIHGNTNQHNVLKQVHSHFNNLPILKSSIQPSFVTKFPIINKLPDLFFAPLSKKIFNPPSYYPSPNKITHMRSLAMHFTALSAELEKPSVSKHMGLPLQRTFPAYNIPWVYVLEKNYGEQLEFHGYYRAIPFNAPTTTEDYVEKLAKTFFPQLHGELSESLNLSDYKSQQHITGSQVLGYPETLVTFRMLARQLFEQDNTPPKLFVQNLGDTAFTGLGSEIIHHVFDALQNNSHQGPKDGYLLVINLNGQSISKQVDIHDTIDAFNRQFGKYVTNLGLFDATNPIDIVAHVQEGAKKTLETGKPHVIFTHAKRIFGHASETPSGNEFIDQGLTNHASNLTTFFKNLIHPDEKKSGPDIANELENASKLAEYYVKEALTPTKIFNRNELLSLTNPLYTQTNDGTCYSLTAQQLLNNHGSITAQTAFSDAIKELAYLCKKENESLMYFTQEGADSGVYSELKNLIDSNFIKSYITNETFINWLAIAFRTLSKANIPIVRAPHNPFQTLSDGPLRQGALLNFSSGSTIKGNVITLRDSFSLAKTTKAGDFKYPYAKVGKMHNEVSFSVPDNTVLLFPPTVAHLKSLAPCILKLFRQGLAVDVHLPTKSFGQGFNKEVGFSTLDINDTIHIKSLGQSQSAKHIAVTYGPFIYDLVSTLNNHVDSDIYCFISSHLPKSFINNIQFILNEGHDVIVTCFDSDPNGFLFHLLAKLEKELGYPASLRIHSCFTEKSYIPVGNDPIQLNEQDVKTYYENYGFFTESNTLLEDSITKTGHQFNISLDKSILPKELIEKEFTYAVELGDRVKSGDIIASYEDDKATIMVSSEYNGIVSYLASIDENNQNAVSTIAKIDEIVFESTNSDSLTNLTTTSTTTPKKDSLTFLPEFTTLEPIPKAHEPMLHFLGQKAGVSEQINLNSLLNFSKTVHSQPLSSSSLLAFISAITINDFNLNFTILNKTDKVIYQEPVIGVAVNRDIENSNEKRLMVPTINMSNFITSQGVNFSALSEHMGRLNDSTLSIPQKDLDTNGHVCQFSNAGRHTGMMVDPMLSKTCIIGIGRRLDDGSSWFTLNFDHGIWADGQQVTSFLLELKNRIENPDTFFNTRFKPKKHNPSIEFRYGLNQSFKN